MGGHGGVGHHLGASRGRCATGASPKIDRVPHQKLQTPNHHTPNTKPEARTCSTQVTLSLPTMLSLSFRKNVSVLNVQLSFLLHVDATHADLFSSAHPPTPLHNLKTPTPNPETHYPKHSPRNTDPETRNPEPESPKPETLNPNPRNPKP